MSGRPIYLAGDPEEDRVRADSYVGVPRRLPAGEIEALHNLCERWTEPGDLATDAAQELNGLVAGLRRFRTAYGIAVSAVPTTDELLPFFGAMLRALIALDQRTASVVREPEPAAPTESPARLARSERIGEALEQSFIDRTFGPTTDELYDVLQATEAALSQERSRVRRHADVIRAIYRDAQPGTTREELRTFLLHCTVFNPDEIDAPASTPDAPASTPTP